jgi:hypothetical protein
MTSRLRPPTTPLPGAMPRGPRRRIVFVKRLCKTRLIKLAYASPSAVHSCPEVSREPPPRAVIRTGWDVAQKRRPPIWPHVHRRRAPASWPCKHSWKIGTEPQFASHLTHLGQSVDDGALDQRLAHPARDPQLLLLVRGCAPPLTARAYAAACGRREAAELVLQHGRDVPGAVERRQGNARGAVPRVRCKIRRATQGAQQRRREQGGHGRRHRGRRSAGGF